jgi:hypothetical protein
LDVEADHGKEDRVAQHFCRACAVIAVVIVTSGQTRPAHDQPWRAKFDEAYGLAKDQAIRHVPPPFIPERIDFYKWAAKSQADAVPEGPASMTVRWSGATPRFGGARFSSQGEGMTVRYVLEGVVGLQPHELDGPRDVLEMEMPGDWSIRYRAKQQDMLDGVAKRLREVTARNLSFAREKVTEEIVLVTGTPKPPDDLPAGETWPLQLELGEIEFIKPAGGAGGLQHLFNTMARATGWPVINESKDMPSNFIVSWSGGRVTEEENLARIPRDQLDKVLATIAKQTGLELKVEQREIERWKLLEKE